MFGRNTKKNWGPFHGTSVGAGSSKASKLLVKILKQVNTFTPLCHSARLLELPTLHFGHFEKCYIQI
jgi:hypothetical protein